MLTIRQRNQIKRVMDNFDFKNVHKCMKLLSWKWFPKNKIPTIQDLRIEARLLLMRIINDINTSTVVVVLQQGATKILFH